MTTQTTLWGNEERVETNYDIVKRGMRLVAAEGITEKQYNTTVVWLSMLEFPELWALINFAADCKRVSRSDEWRLMVRDFLLESAKRGEMPSTETLNRVLREIKESNKQFVSYQPSERLARTL